MNRSWRNISFTLLFLLTAHCLQSCRGYPEPQDGKINTEQEPVQQYNTDSKTLTELEEETASNDSTLPEGDLKRQSRSHHHCPLSKLKKAGSKLLSVSGSLPCAGAVGATGAAISAGSGISATSKAGISGGGRYIMQNRASLEATMDSMEQMYSYISSIVDDVNKLRSVMPEVMAQLRSRVRALEAPPPLVQEVDQTCNNYALGDKGFAGFLSHFGNLFKSSSASLNANLRGFSVGTCFERIKSSMLNLLAQIQALLSFNKSLAANAQFSKLDSFVRSLPCGASFNSLDGLWSGYSGQVVSGPCSDAVLSAGGSSGYDAHSSSRFSAGGYSNGGLGLSSGSNIQALSGMSGRTHYHADAADISQLQAQLSEVKQLVAAMNKIPPMLEETLTSLIDVPTQARMLVDYQPQMQANMETSQRLQQLQVANPVYIQQQIPVETPVRFVPQQVPVETSVRYIQQVPVETVYQSRTQSVDLRPSTYTTSRLVPLTSQSQFSIVKEEPIRAPVIVARPPCTAQSIIANVQNLVAESRLTVGGKMNAQLLNLGVKLSRDSLAAILNRGNVPAPGDIVILNLTNDIMMVGSPADYSSPVLFKFIYRGVTSKVRSNTNVGIWNLAQDDFSCNDAVYNDFLGNVVG